MTLFFAQGLATILGALTQVGVTLWMLGNIEGICTDDQPNGFSCPNGETVYSSSIIWGLIGPARLYSVGGIYSGLVRVHLDIWVPDWLVTYMHPQLTFGTNPSRSSTSSG